MSDNRSIIIVGLVSALILCGGAAAVIAFNDTNNNASDVSDAYSSSTADSLFIKSSGADTQLVKTSSDCLKDRTLDLLTEKNVNMPTKFVQLYSNSNIDQKALAAAIATA